MADDVLTRIREAKQYVDQAFASCISNFEKGKNELECLEALEDTATDLSTEAWEVKMSIWVAMKKITAWPDDVPNFLGTRQIPSD